MQQQRKNQIFNVKHNDILNVKINYEIAKDKKMDFAKFLNLCATLLGFIAILFLSKALITSAEQILRSTYHYSAMGWPSVAIISDKASQKSDTFVSVFLIIFVLGFQLGALFIKDDIPFIKSLQKGIIISIVFVIMVSIITYLISFTIKKNFEKDIKIIAARDRMELEFKSSCPLYRDVEGIAKEYFGITKNIAEDDSDFVRRFAQYINYEVPKDANFSKFKN
ncbi:MAG: hypothetical protein A2Y10_06865 [Planctomycetes bacterium GWF2_41_51]|nr:MAG: hypothetical protein A2Y10_06865 [Planctomycetes bacterium GWF2_41_51]HBG28815.1 hypothetical protein [Phycisphaerales bacterium]